MVRSKTERFRRAIQEAGVMRLDEIHSESRRILGRDVSTQHLHTVYLQRLKKEGWLACPRQGLYIATNPEKRISPDPYLVATKIRPHGYLGYRSALELHGALCRDFPEKYVGLQRNQKFRTFAFQGTTYRPAVVQDPDQTLHLSDTDIGRPSEQTLLIMVQRMHRGDRTVRATTPSRTLVDCVARPKLAGGWTTCLPALSHLQGIDGDQIVSILGWMAKQSLWSRVGFVLERLKENPSHRGKIEDRHLEAIQAHVPPYPDYLDRTAGGERDPRWNLYIPPGYDELLQRQ